ncbi:KCNK18 [Bugula neritina]|uniref:KCNK18 n=1 Tax=Bugula neritina TaxID=10212 RepID=A0A7J7KED0_BUGNE|nr:KCNK18 [Bugula neritina]
MSLMQLSYLAIKDTLNEVYSAVVDSSWDGKRVGETIDTKWEFPGALLYAVTAITTIGYGHVTPKTTLGMCCTMLYCLFGLPLTLMCIANLGKFFARVFRLVYHTICCGVCCICCLSYRQRKMAKKLELEAHSADLEAVGNGKDLTITNDPIATSNSAIGTRQRLRGKLNVTFTKTQVWLSNVKAKFTHSMRDDVTVPVYLCLVVMAAYIVGGALLFSLWDQWEFIEGAYFCFVTLTTIGFGDYVPGIVNGYSGKNGTERLILCSLYVFFGLALIGMCIDLMQADVLHKLRWVAHKMGVLNKDNEKVSFQMSKNVPAAAIHKLSDSSDEPCSSNAVDGKKFNSEISLNDINEISKAPYNRVSTKSVTPHEVAEKENPKSKSDSRIGAVIVTHREPNGELGYAYGTQGSTYTLPGNTQSDNPSFSAPTNEEMLTPPPEYSEYCQNQNNIEHATPVSYYDDLPTHISAITPAHLRLQEVSTPIAHRKSTANTQREDNYLRNGRKDSAGEPLIKDSDLNLEMKADVNGELTLLVTTPTDEPLSRLATSS